MKNSKQQKFDKTIQKIVCLSLILFTFFSNIASSQPLKESVKYGNNQATGKYFTSDDAKLYYEEYGSGDIIILLHGGVFGSIGEFKLLIEKLSKSHKVVCLATRGHGKSEIGRKPYSYNQRAEDVYNLVKLITKGKVTVVGFSDGGYSALKFASKYPRMINKLVVMGVSGYAKGSRIGRYNYNVENLLKQYGKFFSDRLLLMPEPKRWQESLNMLSNMYNTDYIDTKELNNITAPTLIINGDRDDNHKLPEVIKLFEAIKGSSLSLIPACDHVIINCNFPLVWSNIEQFLKS